MGQQGTQLGQVLVGGVCHGPDGGMVPAEPRSPESGAPAERPPQVPIPHLSWPHLCCYIWSPEPLLLTSPGWAGGG